MWCLGSNIRLFLLFVVVLVRSGTHNTTPLVRSLNSQRLKLEGSNSNKQHQQGSNKQ